MPAVAQASLKPELNSTTHIHQIYIKAEPGVIWDHITSPEWSGKYGYRGTSHYELKPGGKFRCMASEKMPSAASQTAKQAGADLPLVVQRRAQSRRLHASDI